MQTSQRKVKKLIQVVNLVFLIVSIWLLLRKVQILEVYSFLFGCLVLYEQTNCSGDVGNGIQLSGVIISCWWYSVASSLFVVQREINDVEQMLFDFYLLWENTWMEEVQEAALGIIGLTAALPFFKGVVPAIFHLAPFRE